MRADAILIVRCLSVRQYALFVDREPEAVTQSGDCLGYTLDLQRRWRLLSEIVGRCSRTTEETDAHAAAVAPVGRRKDIVELAVPNDVDLAVPIDLDVVVAPKLPIVSRRPVEIDFSLLFVTRDIQQYKKISPEASVLGLCFSLIWLLQQ